jgi:hypothetical protein
MSACDVYSYGVVASSTLYVFKGDFPVPDGYSEIDDVQYMVGGEAANSSIVLARLGARVKLDGNWLGNDDRGTRTRALLDRSGVDTSRLPLREDYRGVLEVVFAADKTRTIFGGYGRLLEREDWNMPRPEDVRQAKVICLDPFFGKASLRVAEVGCDAGIPVVTIDCLHDDPLLEYASAVVISDNYIQWKYADHRLEDLFQAYLNATDVARKRSGMADRARSLARSPHIRSMPSTQAPLETPSGPVLCSGSCTDGTTRRRLNLLQRLRVLFVLQRLRVLFVLGFRAR